MTGQPQDIPGRIKTLLAEHILPGPAGVEKIEEHHALLDDLGADSLDCVELALAIEEKFGITVLEEEMAAIVTVGDLIDFVTAEVAEMERAPA